MSFGLTSSASSKTRHQQEGIADDQVRCSSMEGNAPVRSTDGWLPVSTTDLDATLAQVVPSNSTGSVVYVGNASGQEHRSSMWEALLSQAGYYK